MSRSEQLLKFCVLCLGWENAQLHRDVVWKGENIDDGIIIVDDDDSIPAICMEWLSGKYWLQINMGANTVWQYMVRLGIQDAAHGKSYEREQFVSISPKLADALLDACIQAVEARSVIATR